MALLERYRDYYPERMAEPYGILKPAQPGWEEIRTEFALRLVGPRHTAAYSNWPKNFHTRRRLRKDAGGSRGLMLSEIRYNEFFDSEAE